jgi:acyl-CoA synthetase (AMP-forming)/AMP-acid ligase II
MPTIAELVVARAGDTRPALLFEDATWSWDQWVAECASRAALLARLRRDGPFHVGLLLDNVPDYSFWLGAAALAGAVVVGVNPTRRGAELERDITHTDCQLIVTGSAFGGLLDGLDVGVGADRILDVDAPGYARLLAAAPLPDIGAIDDGTGYLLLFTSGTTGAPKACWCSQGRLARISAVVAERYQLTPRDVCYQAMPLFHSNALMTGWGPALAAGATTALRRRFSASGFLPDVRRFGATYFNYVGKPLSYILATPERPDDADNPLVRVFGNEAAPDDIARFARRFGCEVDDGYGSTEGGASVSRVADMPPGALGVGTPGTVVLDPETGRECPPARFDEHGHLLNPDEAIGELVNEHGAAGFEGYYRNEEADRARVRDGKYWTGDLAYRDERGFVYFAGRGGEWLRVDGENIAAAPVERILARHPDVVLVAVYGVPDPAVGDQGMAAVELRPGAAFDGERFGAWVDAQPDLGPVWAPRFVRVVDALPMTETSKVLKRVLQAERWHAPDVWWRTARTGAYRRFTPEDAAELDARIM